MLPENTGHRWPSEWENQGGKGLRAGLKGEVGFLQAEMQDWGMGEKSLKEETA